REGNRSIYDDEHRDQRDDAEQRRQSDEKSIDGSAPPGICRILHASGATVAALRPILSQAPKSSRPRPATCCPTSPRSRATGACSELGTRPSRVLPRSSS